MAQVVATQMVQQRGDSCDVRFDSAGTHASKGSTQPDSRAQNALEKRGYTVKKGRSRKIETKDFERFDLVLAMDKTNLGMLQALCPVEHGHKLKLFLEPTVHDGSIPEVPDPYYGNPEGFERVLNLCEAGIKGWLSLFA